MASKKKTTTKKTESGLKPTWIHLKSKNLLPVLAQVEQGTEEMLLLVNGYQAMNAHLHVISASGRTSDRIYVGSYLGIYIHPKNGTPRNLVDLQPIIEEAIRAQEAKWRGADAKPTA